MKIFIWDFVDHCTQSWHSGGGVVVIAADEARARELAVGQGVTFSENENPTAYAIEATEEKVLLFPDAGCC